MAIFVRLVLTTALGSFAGCNSSSQGVPADAGNHLGDATTPTPDAGETSPLGGPCTAHAGCGEGHCGYVVGSDFQFFAAVCTASCGVDAPACSEGTCFVPGDIYGYCVPECGPGLACRDGLGCSAEGQCTPAECERQPPAGGNPGCCFDNTDCSGGMCHGASCEANQPGRCLPIPAGPDGQCWIDADCARPNGEVLGHCANAEIFDFACTDTVDVVGQPGDCVMP